MSELRHPSGAHAKPIRSHNPVLIAPSILAADFLRLGQEIEDVVKAGADWIHLDMMDRHFVPNLSFGPPVVAGLKNAGHVLDVHLMVERPEDYFEELAAMKAHSINIHVEASPHLQRSLSHIRSLGMKAGVALNPSTPPEFLGYVADVVDIVLIMTVNPGFGGQEFLPTMLAKIQRVREILGPGVRITVDGGITAETAPQTVAVGADVLVAGSSIFKKEDYRAAIQALRGL